MSDTFPDEVWIWIDEVSTWKNGRLIKNRKFRWADRPPQHGIARRDCQRYVRAPERAPETRIAE